MNRRRIAATIRVEPDGAERYRLVRPRRPSSDVWDPNMIRALLRLIGVIVLAAGFILLMYDGAKSIADSRIYIYKLGQLWTDIHVASLQSAEAAVKASLPAAVWDPVVTTVLDQPAWLIFGLIGVALILLGRKRKPLIGYAR
jgi:hypothetical protein